MRAGYFYLLISITYLFLTFFFSQTAHVEAGVKKIAVLDFEDGAPAHNISSNPYAALMALAGQQMPQQERGRMGRSVTDMLINEIVKDGTFKVIERAQLQKVLSEQELSLSGAIDTADAAKIGKILGVSGVVVGSVTHFSTNESGSEFLGIGSKTTTAKVGISARVIDTSTAEVLVAASGNGEESKSSVRVGGLINADHSDFGNTLLGIATKKAVSEVAVQIREQAEKLKESVIDASIAYVDSKNRTVIFDAGKQRGVEKGQIFYVIKVLKEIKSPNTGKVIKRITDSIAETKVIEVEESSSTAVLVKGNVEEIKENDQVSTIK